MAIQKNIATLGEYRGGKGKAISSRFLDVFIGSTDFKSVCKTMRIKYQPQNGKDSKKFGN